jgi:hypothetical protein
MANLTATVRVNLVYQAPGGSSITVPQQTVDLAYGADSEGHVDVPSGTGAAVDFDIPFGSIAAASAMLLINNTSQDLTLLINGDLTGQTLAAGKPLYVHTPLTEAKVVTTDVGPSTETERVSFFVFGDPE